MEYREYTMPPHLAGLIKTRWTLRSEVQAERWIEQQATPDGCIEIIFRRSGRSWWDGDQPHQFVVGLITRPQAFRISGEAAFDAIRLWPWTVSLLADIPLHQLTDCWAEWEGPAQGDILRSLESAGTLNQMGLAISGAASVAEMSRATRMPPRRLQRWFERHVGMPPRSYLQLLRFQNAFAALPGGSSLADQAAEHGFADQSHMSRAMRRFAGTPPGRARTRAKGPFLS